MAETPHLLNGDGDPWTYYVPGHDPDELYGVDEPELLEWRAVWMRPMPVSSLDPEERGDWEAVERDDNGRFRSAFCWIECDETHPDARPFLGVKYKPVSEPEPLPPDLLRVLRDQTITIDRDREIRLADGRTLWDHLHEWRNAPSHTVSAPAAGAAEETPDA